MLQHRNVNEAAKISLQNACLELQESSNDIRDPRSHQFFSFIFVSVAKSLIANLLVHSTIFFRNFPTRGESLVSCDKTTQDHASSGRHRVSSDLQTALLIRCSSVVSGDSSIQISHVLSFVTPLRPYSCPFPPSALKLTARLLFSCSDNWTTVRSC